MSTWYRAGTASFTNGGTSVSGSGTAWIANARTGDALHAPDGRAYEIASVNSNTSITLASSFLGSTASGADYAIQPTRGITVEFNNNAVSLLSTVQSYVDTALAGRFPDGSAGAPSHSFASDTDTGMYRDAADRIGFSAGGARRAFLSTAAMQIDVPVTGTAVTQSPTDTTAGRLLKVGDEGPTILTGFGSAATATVTQSPTDTTAGRLLKVGDEGPTVLSGFGTAATEDDSRYVNVTDTQTIAGVKDFTDGVEAASYGGDGVTQSFYDITADRITKVGDFGLGQTGTMQTLDNINNLDLPASFWRTTSSTEDTDNVLPSSVCAFFRIPYRTGAGSRYVFDLIGPTSGDDEGNLGYRYHDGGSNQWTSWRKLYHTGNLLGTVSQSGGDPTGAVFEDDSNDDGHYIRYASGKQECWRTFTIEESSDQRLTLNVILPATFASTNEMVAQLNVPMHSSSEFNGLSRFDVKQWGTSAPGGTGRFTTSSIATTVFTVDGAVSPGATITNMQLTVKGRWF